MRAPRYNKINRWRGDETLRTEPAFDPLLELVLELETDEVILSAAYTRT